jgi:hypothetical protein
VSGGEWNTNRERKQLAADQREQDREMLRQEKRALRDLRFCAERSTLSAAEWRDFMALHALHGKEGIRELWESLVPYWNACQQINGGEPCPADLVPSGLKLSAKNARTNPSTRKPPSAPRKPRTDKGKPRASYTPRKPAADRIQPQPLRLGFCCTCGLVQVNYPTTLPLSLPQLCP